MSAQSGQPADDGRPARDEGRSFTSRIRAMVAPAADERSAPPPGPTFTAAPGGPPGAAVPGQALPPDGAAGETAAALGPDDGPATGPEPALGDPVSETPPAGSAAAGAVDRAPAAGLPGTAGLDEPLLSDVDGLRTRWQRVQAGFVDDPRDAVGEAADLIEQTAQALVGALRQRQRELRVLWEQGPADAAAADGAPAGAGGADTEHLRRLMQRYRALFDQLARP